MIQKQPVSIPFSKGMNQKIDPWQLPIGEFELLVNAIFTKEGLLQKRNGFASLPSLPDASNTYTTTLNDNLLAVGDSIVALDESNGTWISKGSIQPMEVSTLPLIRNSIHQIQCDTAFAPNGLVCTAYTENNGGTTSYKYAIAVSSTGQNIVAPTVIPDGAGTASGSPRVFILGAYFIIAFTNTISAVDHLQYIAISYNNPTAGPVAAAADLASAYSPTATLSWDGVVLGENLYFAYNTTTGGQSVKAAYLTSSFSVSSAITFAGKKATVMSLCADLTSPTVPLIYISFYDSVGALGYSAVIDQFLNIITAPVLVIPSGAVVNIASVAHNGSVSIYSEVNNAYSYDMAIPTHYINKVTMTQSGSVGATIVSIRSVGLASKAFLLNETEYYLSAFQSPYQPSYFLINGTESTSAAPVVAAKLAYSNGGGYLGLGLPSVTLSGSTIYVAYLFKDLISSVNKGTALPSGTQVDGIYAQTGIKLGILNITNEGSIQSSEIGGDLHLSGGFLWMYDGYLPVEHNFFVWPDSVKVATDATVGSMTAQQYFYQVIYEWADSQGNIFESAPSIPVSVTLTSDTSVLINVPTLRLTYKTASPVKIVIYRWSAAQPVYYQTTSITSALLNDTTTDSVSFIDTHSDASILGNSILYTTGGVVEDTNAPATNVITLFDTRLWLVDAEDPNLLWYSKQVIEATPVEMSDLLTIYVAPNTGTTGSTGPMRAMAPMDDKLIIFKANAIYYINGTGPDNTGANSQYSQPIFITSTVGCSNQASLVLMPNGIMFQSDKGIWLLGRDLATTYLGAPVENFNSSTVTSANAIPQTNQVRFTLNTGETLVYDYYYNRWGIFEGSPAISSCLYQGLHTQIDQFGDVSQENPGSYLDGSSPVLMALTTSWINVAGLQGYQRAFFFFLLGKYLTPHTLSLTVAYDYNSSPAQSSLIQPTNFSSAVPSAYGVPTPAGAPDDVENWRVFLAKQRCQSFQVSIQEIYDPSFGVPAGAGLTLSGLNLVVGIKKGWRNIGAASTVGSNNG